MEYLKLSDYLKSEYGEKIYKLSLQSGCTCPNRDGLISYGGCTFCSGEGSGEFASAYAPLGEQIENAKKYIRSKTGSKRFIAYFQSYTNTYGDPDKLKKLYMEACMRDDIAILSLGTRPDCISDEILDMLKDLNQIKPVWIELGLQTIHEETAESFRRGYGLSVFEDAYRRLKDAGLTIIVHIILGLPEESEQDMLETVKYLAGLNPVLNGIKIHMLQILKGTDMAKRYSKEHFHIMSLEEYGELLIKCLKLLPKETVVHRITGDGAKRLLIEPAWCADKKHVLNTLNKMIKEA